MSLSDSEKNIQVKLKNLYKYTHEKLFRKESEIQFGHRNRQNKI